MKKIRISILLIAIASAFLIGCESNKNVDSIKAESSKVESEQTDDTKNTDNEKSEEEVLEQKELFKIYDADISNSQIGNPVEVSIQSSETLDNKVKAVADEIIKKWFEGMQYEVSTKTEDGRIIAVINLIDTKGPQDESSWFQQFQGSDGGTVDSRRIINNIIQKDHSGQWIEGIKVLYNGEVCEFEHAPYLGKINYKQI